MSTIVISPVMVTMNGEERLLGPGVEVDDVQLFGENNTYNQSDEDERISLIDTWYQESLGKLVRRLMSLQRSEGKDHVVPTTFYQDGSIKERLQALNVGLVPHRHEISSDVHHVYIRVIERTSSRHLKAFFQQWLIKS